MVTNELRAIFSNVKTEGLYCLVSCSETKCTIVLQMHALIAELIAADGVKNGENWLSRF